MSSRDHHHHRHAHTHPEDGLLTADVHFEVKHEQNFNAAHEALVAHAAAAPAGIAHFAVAYGHDEHGVSIAVVRQGFHSADAWIAYVKNAAAETTALGASGRRTLVEFVGQEHDIAKVKAYLASGEHAAGTPVHYLVLAPGGFRM